MYIKQGKFDEAEKILIKAPQMGKNADVYNNLGVVYSEKNELSRAIRKFEKAIQLNPKSADAYFNLGLVYLKMNKEKKANGFFEKAIELNPEYKKRIKIH